MPRLKLNFYNLFFLLLLLLSLIIRLNSFDYPLLNSETHRDYLVGKHILLYKEIPLTGPCCLWNGVFGPIRNNPVYYYFIALILTIKEDILFLGLVNILLQLLTLIILYILAKKLFGKSCALIATLLFGISAPILKQSLFFWQPHAMQPFVNLSYLLLLLFYLNRSYTLLSASIVAFVFAASLHNPPYAILPTFILLILFSLKRQNRPISYYFSALATFGLSLFLTYLPLLIFFVKHKSSLDSQFAFQKLLVPSSDFIQKFLTTTDTLFSTFFFKENSLSTYLVLLIIIGTIWYLRTQKNKEKKQYVLVLVFAILQFLLVSSIFNATVWSYYLTPIFGFFIIFISEITNTLFSKGVALKVVGIITVIFLVKTFSLDFQTLKTNSLLENKRNVENASLALKNEILDIQRSTKQKDLGFFQIKVYAGNIESPKTADLAFWTILEKDLKTKFIQTGDFGNSYKAINKDEYLFVICQSYPNPINVEQECIQPFLEEYKGYRLTRIIYNKEPFLIHLASY